MAGKSTSLKLPVVITYRNTERSRTKKVKILRGKTDENLDKLYDLKIYGINEKTVIDHIGVGYRYVPIDKLTASDQKAIAAVRAENLKHIAN
jgi:hypothetical protein|tara:strand:+ start:245 stop:520 length:276 start_codon:yes stop_codon:yes gene_type:complete